MPKIRIRHFQKQRFRFCDVTNEETHIKLVEIISHDDPLGRYYIRQKHEKRLLLLFDRAGAPLIYDDELLDFRLATRGEEQFYYLDRDNHLHLLSEFNSENILAIHDGRIVIKNPGSSGSKNKYFHRQDTKRLHNLLLRHFSGQEYEYCYQRLNAELQENSRKRKREITDQELIGCLSRCGYLLCSFPHCEDPEIIHGKQALVEMLAYCIDLVPGFKKKLLQMDSSFFNYFSRVRGGGACVTIFSKKLLELANQSKLSAKAEEEYSISQLHQKNKFWRKAIDAYIVELQAFLLEYVNATSAVSDEISVIRLLLDSSLIEKLEHIPQGFQLVFSNKGDLRQTLYGRLKTLLRQKGLYLNSREAEISPVEQEDKVIIRVFGITFGQLRRQLSQNEKYTWLVSQVEEKYIDFITRQDERLNGPLEELSAEELEQLLRDARHNEILRGAVLDKIFNCSYGQEHVRQQVTDFLFDPQVPLPNLSSFSERDRRKREREQKEARRRKQEEVIRRQKAREAERRREREACLQREKEAARRNKIYPKIVFETEYGRKREYSDLDEKIKSVIKGQVDQQRAEFRFNKEDQITVKYIFNNDYIYVPKNLTELICEAFGDSVKIDIEAVTAEGIIAIKIENWTDFIISVESKCEELRLTRGFLAKRIFC